MDSQSSNEKRSRRGRMGLLIAAAIGAILGLFFAPKRGEETREEVINKAKDLMEKFHQNRAEIQSNIKEIFGEVSEELEQNYMDLREKILSQMEEMRKRQNLNESKFKRIVYDKVQELAKQKDWSKSEVQRLIENLQEDWESLRPRK